MAENEKNLADRFVEAWASIENPELDGINPHFKNRYATLKATLGVVRDACRPHGIAYLQRLVEDPDGFRLHSSIADGSGETIALSTFPVENVPNSQAFGSELTYKKRQQAQADWGIVGDDDDDGEAVTASQQSKASGNTRKAKTARPAPNGAAHGQSAAARYDKMKRLKARALELGITDDGMRGALDNILHGKAMKDATDAELKACEGCIAGLIRDKEELLAEQGREGEDVG